MSKILPKKHFDFPLELDQAKAAGKHVIDHFLTCGLIGLYGSLQLEKRLERFQESLSRVSEQVKNMIDDKVSFEYLNSDEYKEIMVKTVAQAVALENLTKMQYFRSSFINNMLRLDLDKSKKLFFLSSLSNLSDAALDIFVSILRMYNKERNQSLVSVSYLAERLGITDKEFLVALLRELDQFNFIEITWPQAKAFDQSNVAFEVRKLAEHFFNYITVYAYEESTGNGEKGLV